MPIAIQNRILLGITFFVGILLLIGWIAINEAGRMSGFTNEYSGRSIENGAAIFMNNCSVCHNPDGLGQKNRAPGLLNPMLFADSNPAAVLQVKIVDQQKLLDAAVKQLADIDANKATVVDLTAKLAAETDATKKADLQTQIDSLNTAIKRAEETKDAAVKGIADQKAQIEQDQAELKALEEQGWDPNRLVRLKEVAWQGTLQAYVQNAVAAGRPLSGLYWGGNIMPTWGQTYGGPMRPDEVADVTNFVLNWRDQALKMEPKEVNQQFSLPGVGTASPPPTANKEDIIFTKYGKNPQSSVLDLGELTGGNSVNGEKLYAAYGCPACHLAGQIAPMTKGTFYRVKTERLKVPQNAGMTAQQYMAQSVLYPLAYIVPTYQPIMPQAFGEQMDLTQLKDIIAFLTTQNTP